MKKSILLLIVTVLFSCKHKEPTQAEFMQRALKGNDYKIVLANFQTVQDSLVMMKKRPVDTNVIIYEFNNIAGTKAPQVKNIAQVVKQMDSMVKDSAFLKNVQVHLADTLAKQHRDSVAQGKN